MQPLKTCWGWGWGWTDQHEKVAQSSALPILSPSATLGHTRDDGGAAMCP